MLPLAEMFSYVYLNQLWGQKPGQPFFSGNGSHAPETVDSYIEAVQKLLQSLKKPSVLDIGCGDFNIGSQLACSTKHYSACDIVEAVINDNQQRWPLKNVSFHCLDACKDDLPEADLVIVRQVFQHLGNRQIKTILDKLRHYPYLLVTEHIPEGTFTANRDKPAGPDSRLRFKSGIDIRQAPFDFDYVSERLIDEVAEKSGFGGILQTRLFEQSLER